MFDILETPVNYESASSSQASPGAASQLSDEEIALRLVEIHARDSRDKSIESLVKNYFYALSLIKNKSSETTQPPQNSESSSYETASDDERDMLSEKEYISDADADGVDVSDIQQSLGR
ncbi:MAG: hypothetical protein QXO69_01065 [archaeon]